MSSTLKKSIGLENDYNEQVVDGDESISKMRDPEEIQFIKGIGQFVCQLLMIESTFSIGCRYNLHIYKIYIVIDILDEQAELNEKIMEVEKSRLEATLNLLSSKMEVAKEFRVTKEIYGEMISNENGNYLKLYLLSFTFIIFIFITLLKNMYNPLFCLIRK